jgi:hypothetical protein
MIPKPEKMYQMNANVPNGHKISQISIKCYRWAQNKSTFFNIRHSKISPNWDFWLENKPSGNPDIK